MKPKSRYWDSCHCDSICDEEEKIWSAYLRYLKDWADKHIGMEYCGTSPISSREFIAIIDIYSEMNKEN